MPRVFLLLCICFYRIYLALYILLCSTLRLAVCFQFTFNDIMHTDDIYNDIDDLMILYADYHAFRLTHR